MGVINYAAERHLLTVARGHPYERDAFAGLFEGLEEFDVCHVEQPAAQRLMSPDAARDYDALVCYDMPGVDFTRGGPEAGLVEPDTAFRENYLAMLEAGVGIVFMHHALAAWPAWPQFAEIIGGRFHYRSSELRGRSWPDSGYRHGVTHTVSTVGAHPVLEGVPEQFEMTDELYLCPVFEADVQPLLRSDYSFTAEHFYSAARAVAGDMYSREGWSHSAGCGLVGWVTSWGSSPLVYLQGGDDAQALGNPHFKRLVHNAVRWVSSEDGRRWARQRQNVKGE